MYVVESLRRAEAKASSLPVALRVNFLLYGLAVLALALLTMELRGGSAAVHQVQTFPGATATTLARSVDIPTAQPPPEAGPAPAAAASADPAPAAPALPSAAAAAPSASRASSPPPAAPTTTAVPATAAPATAAPPALPIGGSLSQPPGQAPAFIIPTPAPGFFTPLPLPAPSAATSGPAAPALPPPLIIPPPDVATPAPPSPAMPFAPLPK